MTPAPTETHALCNEHICFIKIYLFYENEYLYYFLSGLVIASLIPAKAYSEISVLSVVFSHLV